MLRVGEDERRAGRMLLHPARKTVGVYVHSDDADSQAAPFGDGVAVTTPNVKEARCYAGRASGDERSVELDTLDGCRLLEGLRLSQQVIHVAQECRA